MTRDPEITDPRDPYRTVHRVSAGPYTLALPANGVAILYEDGKQLPGGVGYLDALIQFAGEVIRLRSMLDTIRRDPEITDPRDPYKRPDIVTELDRWLVSRASLREATVSHALLQAARDEVMALRTRCAISDVDILLEVGRNEALEEAAMVADRWRERPEFDKAAAIAAAIRALRGGV